MKFLDFIIYALAVWRLTSLVVREEDDGPYELFAKLRYFLGVRYDENSNPYGRNQIAKAIMCVWCFSVWAGIAWTIVRLFSPEVLFWVSFPLAISAAVIIIEEMITRG